MYYEGESQSNVYGTGMATSKDGIQWTKTGKVTIPSKGWDTNFNNVGGVDNLNGTYVATYYGGKNGTASIGVASSSDGVNWTPFTGNPIITPRSKSWDSSLSFGDWWPMLVVVGNNYYVYFEAPGTNAQNILNVRIGLAILPAASVQMPEFPYATSLLIVVFLSVSVLSVTKRSRTNA